MLPGVHPLTVSRVASFDVCLPSRVLFRAVCSSIFSTIIDQAPFAIEDLMKEVEAAGASDSDSGQASEEDDEEDRLKGKPSGKAVVRKKTVKQINGTAGPEQLHIQIY